MTESRTRRMVRGGLWRWYLAIGVSVAALYLLLPRGGLAQGLLYVGLGVSMVTAIAVGVGTHRPPAPRAWYFIVAGTGLYTVVANPIWYLYPVGLGKTLPYPSVADGLYLIGYILELVGLVVLIRARLGRSDRAGMIDTALITIAVGVVSWVFLMKPYVELAGLSPMARLVSMAYPMMDILLLAVLVRITFGSGSRSFAYWFLTLYLVGELVGDTAYAITSLRGTFTYGSPLFLGWMLSYVFLGAAALHPSMSAMSARVPEQKPEPTLWRLGFLAGAALVPPCVLVIQEVQHQHLDVTLIAVAWILMFLLVFARLRTLMADVSHLKRTGAALEEKYQAIVESTNDWIWESDLDGFITYSNAAVATILGYSPEELIGRNLLTLVDEEQREEVLARWLRLATEKRGWTGVVNRWRDGRGSLHYLESNATPILTEAGEIKGYRGADRDVTERKALEQKIVQQALYDPLTALANRALFADRLEQGIAGAPRHGRRVVVLVMDLNGFKAVNDTFGHSVGDQLLIEVAARTRSCVRPSDTVARLGGDEFAILLEDAGVQEAVRVAERILERFREPFDIEGQELFIDGSIGIAESPSGSVSAEALLRDADAAMYTAKRSGKGAHEIFQPEFHVEVLRRFELSTDLRRAVEHGEFVLRYQPIVTLKEGTIIGVEALIRWIRPDGTMVSPADFIPVAEQTGLIIPIDRWVMKEACRQVRAWDQEVSNGPISMSVNVSVRQLNDARLMQEVQETIQETGLDPARLTLEITESVLIQDVETTLAVLQDLKALGVRLAIDDFGIGFSSLNYLRRLPVDIVKIDRSFVAGIATQSSEWTLARGIVRLVHELGLETVAEGVERADQRAHLQALGCRLAQGFFFARPMEPDAIAALLAKASSRSA